jgi:2-keto-3-deoxy-L-rhamnonate aldolase RhmA
MLADPFDLVWVDLEHAALGVLDAQDVILGAQATGAWTLARLPADARGLITKMLDAGVDGIVLADVTSPAQVSDAWSWMHHPPVGERGFGPRRLQRRAKGEPAALANASLWIQIESDLTETQLREIIGASGIDAVVVGTSDLSFAVGTPLDVGSQQLRDAVSTTRAIADQANVPFGVAGALDGDLRPLIAGACVLVLGTDVRLCAAAVDSAAGQMREILNAHRQEVDTSD